MQIANNAHLADIVDPGMSSAPSRLHEAAQQFESFFVSAMLKIERDSGNSWLGTDEDDAGGTAVEMAETEFARAIGKQGGFGLARLIEQAVEHPSPSRQPDHQITTE